MNMTPRMLTLQYIRRLLLSAVIAAYFGGLSYLAFINGGAGF